MTTTQRGESINNLMKDYLDATTSLTNFLKAFESALDQRKEDMEFVKFCKDYTNAKLVTKSPYEKQAMDFLTKYALDKTQKQLLECMMYKCEEIIKWFKDPNDQNIMKMYQVFYNLVGSSSNQNANNGNSPETNDDDYEYLLNRTWQKVQQLIKAKPVTAKVFYILLDESVQKEITMHISEKRSINQVEDQIKNHVAIRQKEEIIYIKDVYPIREFKAEVISSEKENIPPLPSVDSQSLTKINQEQTFEFEYNNDPSKIKTISIEFFLSKEYESNIHTIYKIQNNEPRNDISAGSTTSTTTGNIESNTNIRNNDNNTTRPGIGNSILTDISSTGRFKGVDYLLRNSFNIGEDEIVKFKNISGYYFLQLNEERLTKKPFKLDYVLAKNIAELIDGLNHILLAEKKLSAINMSFESVVKLAKEVEQEK
ncbi:2906_t:CDS:2, partial [Funneliformis geosporum]